MNIKKLKKNWDEYARTDPFWAILTDPDKKGGGWQIDEFFKTGEEEILGIIKYCQSLGFTNFNGQALDFGCGVGRLTQALGKYFNQVYGVDVAPNMIKLAKKYNHFPNKCHFQLNEQNNLKMFPSNSFNFIYSSLALQHIEPWDSIKYLKEFLRILKPGGLLIFQLPTKPKVDSNKKKNILFIKELIKPLISKFLLSLYYRAKSLASPFPTMEMFGIKKNQVIKLLEKNGGKIITIKENDNIPGWFSNIYFVSKK